MKKLKAVQLAIYPDMTMEYSKLQTIQRKSRNKQKNLVKRSEVK